MVSSLESYAGSCKAIELIVWYIKALDSFKGFGRICSGICSPSSLIVYYAILLELSKPNSARIPVLEIWRPCRHASPECLPDFPIRMRGQAVNFKAANEDLALNPMRLVVGDGRVHKSLHTWFEALKRQCAKPP